MADSSKNPGKQFAPVTQVGIKGLQTFNDPQFIDDQALADALNIDIDQQQMCVRQGINLLYDKPVGEGTGQQIFRTQDSRGNEFLLAKYAQNWYVWYADGSEWIKIASQNPSDPLFQGTAWTPNFYNSTSFNGGVGDDIAFFADSGYNGADNTSQVLEWPMGITTLANAANIGDSFLELTDAASIFVSNNYGALNVAGELVAVYAVGSFVLNGDFSSGDTTITGLPRTDIIQPGQSLSGTGIVAGTRVVSVVDDSSITISIPTTADAGTTFTAKGDVVSGSESISNLNDEGGVITSGLQISGSGIPGGTLVESITGGGGLVAAGTGDVSNGSSTITNFHLVYGSLQVGSIVQGTNIPNGTVVVDFSTNNVFLSANATSSGSGEDISFSLSTTAITITNAATLNVSQDVLTFATIVGTNITFSDPDFVLLYSPLTQAVPAGTAIAQILQDAPVPQGNVLGIFLQKLWIIAGARVYYSASGEPFNFSSSTFVSGTLTLTGGSGTDFQPFGQFALIGQEDGLQVVQLGFYTNGNTGEVAEYFTLQAYISGQGMGPTESQSSVQFNNQYFYPSLSNGIFGLMPNFTGTSSSAGITVISDSIHNLYLSFDFGKGIVSNRKIYWLVNTIATPSQPSQTYLLVYSFLRTAFTLYQAPIKDMVVYGEELTFLGNDGRTYTPSSIGVEQDTQYIDRFDSADVSYEAYALTKRADFGDPSNPKVGEYCMVQGTISTGSTMNIDVFYNEGGSLGQVRYQVVGDKQQPYIKSSSSYEQGSPVLASIPLGYDDSGLLTYRVYIELNQAFGFNTFQVKLSSGSPGAFWSASIVSPNLELAPIPVENVISPS